MNPEQVQQPGGRLIENLLTVLFLRPVDKKHLSVVEHRFCGLHLCAVRQGQRINRLRVRRKASGIDEVIQLLHRRVGVALQLREERRVLAD